MKKRIFCILMAILLCASMFAGCNNQENSGDLVTGTYEAPAKDTEGTLTLFVRESDKQAFIIANSKFKALYPKVEVDITTYDATSGDTSALEKQQVKQMTGEGADIVEMDFALYTQICDIYKVQQSGAYIDLNQYFDNDPNWSWEGYSKAVVEGMRFGDKSYLLPLYFMLNTLVTTEDLLAESKIDLEQCKTGIDQLNEFAKCGEKINAGEYDFTLFDISDRFGSWYETFDVNPVTFESGEGKVEWTDDFDQLMQAYNAAGRQLGWFEPWTDARLAELEQCMNQTYYERLVENHNVFLLSDWLSGTMRDIGEIAEKGEKPVVVPLYTADGNGITATAASTVSISNGSQNKELAYEFIKCLLHEDAQVMLTTSEIDGKQFVTATYQPLHQGAARRVAVSNGGAFSHEVTTASGESVTVTSEEYTEQYIELADKVVYTYMVNAFGSTVNDYFRPYFKQEKSLEDCYEDAKSKLEIYVSE